MTGVMVVTGSVLIGAVIALSVGTKVDVVVAWTIAAVLGAAVSQVFS